MSSETDSQLTNVADPSQRSRDRGLLISILIVSVVALAASWFALRAGELLVLKRETTDTATHWASFIKNNLEDIESALAGGLLSAGDRHVLDLAISEGNVARYKFYSATGRVLVANRSSDLGFGPGDIGVFPDGVMRGKSVALVKDLVGADGEHRHVGEAFVPFMRDGRFLGAIKVYVDMTRHAGRLHKIGNVIMVGLLSLLAVFGGICSVFVRRNIKGRDAELRELMVSRARAVAAEQEAARANEAKSGFLATMSHEIRTPMNGVLGMLDVLLDNELSDDQRAYAETARDSAKALLTIINDILDLSKLEAGRLELEHADFELENVAEHVVSALTATARDKGLDIILLVAPGAPPWVRGDAGRLRQILFNLVGNAVKFTETGGVAITITSRPVGGGKVELHCEITDTGIGIAADAQAKLFSRFTQAEQSTASQYGGSGLGLWICKQLIELMEGAIGVDSAPGQGSTFWFNVRFEIGDAVNATTAKATAPVTTPGGLRILVAEDNRINQQVVIAMLGRAGHRIDVVDDGEAAVAAVANDVYDLVLMDIQMPRMDGIAATRAIRQLPGEAGRIPIVALTANAMDGDREVYLAAGMNDYVSKPLDAERLSQAIANAGGGHGGDRQPTAPPPPTTDDQGEALRSFADSLDNPPGADG